MVKVLKYEDIKGLVENDRLQNEIAFLIERGKLKLHEVKIKNG